MNSLKDKIKNNEVTIGSWISLGCTATCEIMSSVGFDWLVIDMEHTDISYSKATELIRIIDLSHCIPLVRVAENNPRIIKRVMDLGAHGILVPMVNTIKDAQKAVDSVYYPPTGLRGVGLFRAQKYGNSFIEYKEWLEKEVIIIVQIEHIKAVENLEDILSVEGVDGFIIGPYDLSSSLGYPGQFSHHLVIDALNEVECIMRLNNKVGGFHIVYSNQKKLKEKINQGYKFLAYSVDMIFFSEKVNNEFLFLSKIKNEKKK